MKKTFCLVLVSMLLVLLLVGCKTTIKTSDGKVSIKGDSFEVTDEEGNKATITSNGQKIVAESEDGKLTIGENITLPEGFPENLFPIYSAEQITLAGEEENGTLGVMFTSSASINDAFKYYKEKLKGASDVQTLSIEGSNALSGKKDTWFFNIIIVQNNSSSAKSNITISLEKVAE